MWQTPKTLLNSIIDPQKVEKERRLYLMSIAQKNTTDPTEQLIK